MTEKAKTDTKSTIFQLEQRNSVKIARACIMIVPKIQACQGRGLLFLSSSLDSHVNIHHISPHQCYYFFSASGPSD